MAKKSLSKNLPARAAAPIRTARRLSESLRREDREAPLPGRALDRAGAHPPGGDRRRRLLFLFPAESAVAESTTTAQAGKHGERVTSCASFPRRRQGDIGVYLWGSATSRAENGDGQNPRRRPVDEGAFRGGADGQGGRSSGAARCRPYEAQLAQYKAQQEHDEALLGKCED